MAYTVNVKIEGISPLLQNRFLTDGADRPSVKRTGRPDYKEEADSALYRTPDGIIYQPAAHVEGSLRKAATSFKVRGQGKRSYAGLILSSVFVRPDVIPHLIPEYVIDGRAVVVQRNRVIRYRPRFDQWALSFMIEVLDDQFPLSVLNEILVEAGKSVGIGDYRPRYGRFVVTKFELAG